jgi:hypothetical protein
MKCLFKNGSVKTLHSLDTFGIFLKEIDMKLVLLIVGHVRE